MAYQKTRILAWTTALLLTALAPAYAGTITINSGSTLLISGGELDLDCDDVKDGGSLTITGGVVKNLNLVRESGSNYSGTGGTVQQCGDFYIISSPQGTSIIVL
jgi:hypothetical protein